MANPSKQISGFMHDAQWTVVTSDKTKKYHHLKQLKPQINETSHNPKMTAAISQAIFDKMNPWLVEQGWTKKELNFIKKYVEFAKSKVEGEAGFFISYQLLKQAVEKKNIEVFRTAPKVVFTYLVDLAEIVDLLREKGEDPIYAEMLKIVEQAVGVETFKPILLTEPTDKSNRCVRRVLKSFNTNALL